MRKIVSGMSLACLLVAGGASAHEGGTDHRGTVKQIDERRIVLTTPQGDERTVAMGPGTRILRGPVAVPLAEVRVGERAVVHTQMRDGKSEATEVRLAAKPK
jgi:hypothetical protein